MSAPTNSQRARAAVFEENRGRLWRAAYSMLGSRDDAEDLVQETYLRWHRADTDDIRAPQAWLVTTITRLSIDRLRRRRAERELYTGPWLPEPVVDESEPSPGRHAELASKLSVALLAVLERLAPEERAAFLPCLQGCFSDVSLPPEEFARLHCLPFVDDADDRADPLQVGLTRLAQLPILLVQEARFIPKEPAIPATVAVDMVLFCV